MTAPIVEHDESHWDEETGACECMGVCCSIDIEKDEETYCCCEGCNGLCELKHSLLARICIHHNVTLLGEDRCHKCEEEYGKLQSGNS